LSKEQVANGLKSFGKLRFKMNHSRIIAISALLLILVVAFTLRTLPIRWEIPNGQIRLNEFDPYYQYSITQHMVTNGLLSPYTEPWINTQQWYPGGLDMSYSFPALPMTAAILYQVVSFFGVNIDLMAFCSMLAVVLGTLACLIIYFIGKDIGGRAVGLFAALFLALAPSFLQRSSLGFFDSELPGVIGLLLFMFMFLRSLDPNKSFRKSLIYSIGAALALAYFISGWGAAYFVLDLTALFVFLLVILKRYTPRLLISYSVTMGLALLIATQVPYVGLNYLTTGPIIPVAGVFILLLVAELLRHNISSKTKLVIAVAAVAGIVVAFVPMWYFGYLGDIAGKFISVLNPLVRSATPLIESVAEHRISAWGNLYYELGIGIIFFLLGLYFVLKNPTNRNIFLLTFSVTALYFASSMVRLLVIFAPIFAIMTAIGVIGLLTPFMNLLKEAPGSGLKIKRKLARVSKEYSGLAVLLIFVILLSNVAFSPQTGGMPRVYNSAYTPTSISSSSLPLGGASLTQPVTEWTDMLTYTSNNLKSTDVVVAWWDYGYWLSILGNVTTLVDNATVNSTQIENVGFALMGSEEQSLKMLSSYDQSRTKYVLVFTVVYLAQPSSSTGTSTYIAVPANWGDEGKWMWMARISGQAHDRLTDDGYMDADISWTDEYSFGNVSEFTSQWEWSEQGMNSTIYKLISYTVDQYCAQTGGIVTPFYETVEPTYFKTAYIAGLNTYYNQYGGIIPLIGLYEIDWEAYNNATGN
jgi:dolichyl-diphosphooligosaccharide---protein glycosyltransferase